MEIEVVLDAGAIIGELPTWSSDENALYWIDVKKPALYRYDPATEVEETWTMPSDIGAFALVAAPAGAGPVAVPKTRVLGFMLVPDGSGESGAVDRDITLPVSQPTIYAFGGDMLDVLYVTSAADKLSSEERLRKPLAGALLRLRPARGDCPALHAALSGGRSSFRALRCDWNKCSALAIPPSVVPSPDFARTCDQPLLLMDTAALHSGPGLSIS